MAAADAGRRRSEVLASVGAAASRDDATARVAELLGLEPELADQLLDLPLAWFLTGAPLRPVGGPRS